MATGLLKEYLDRLCSRVGAVCKDGGTRMNVRTGWRMSNNMTLSVSGFLERDQHGCVAVATRFNDAKS